MATSPLTSFEELIDRARHSPSIAFEKTRGGVETIDTMLTNARPPTWKATDVLQVGSCCTRCHLGMQWSKPEL
jgi:hypothetical protein